MIVPVFIQKIFGSATWKIPCAEPTLFLTFDDGPVSEVTPSILDILQRYNAKATFFCLGENMIRHPVIFDRILKEGHAIGNHTFHHLNGWKTRLKNYMDDVAMCDEVLNGKVSIHAPHLIESKRPVSGGNYFFRPPYGKLTISQYAALKLKYSIIMWDVLSCDYDVSLKGEECFQKVANNASSGSIIVFHDSAKAKDRVLDALPKVLEHFSKRNYLFRAIREKDILPKGRSTMNVNG